MATLTIGQLANLTRVSTSTLRYYEEQGLLKPSGRTDAGYRIYGPEAERTLMFIQRAQRLGFSLSDIRLLLRGLESGDLLDETVTAVAEERYFAIERQLTELLVQRHEMGVFLLDLKARAQSGRGDSEDLYERLIQRVCGHDHGDSQAQATLAWLLERTGCSLARFGRDQLVRALEGKHIHVWRDGDGYRVLIPGYDPALEEALTEIAALEANCHAHGAPRLESTDEGFLFTAEGDKAFLFAQFFLDLESENSALHA
ncbi:MerR family transcriptional regulator [Candidatus Rariloculus sp.]|uniref:MerR family transcriptional regulator n=1 Tax=Candidatus Rariloculus sp. TaxID=3101265 RepID=UPI003D0F7C66